MNTFQEALFQVVCKCQSRHSEQAVRKGCDLNEQVCNQVLAQKLPQLHPPTPTGEAITAA